MKTPTPEPTKMKTPTPEPTKMKTPTPEPTKMKTPTPEPTKAATPRPIMPEQKSAPKKGTLFQLFEVLISKVHSRDNL